MYAMCSIPEVKNMYSLQKFVTMANFSLPLGRNKNPQCLPRCLFSVSLPIKIEKKMPTFF